MIKVTSFYKFFPIAKESLQVYKADLLQEAKKLKLRGLALLGEEGINASLCGKEDNLEEAKRFIRELFKKDFFWKDSYCETWSFKRLSIKVKKEIITVGKTYPKLQEQNSHLTPKEWEGKIKKKDVQILDLRNEYEVELGRFKRAVHLHLEAFQDFPAKLDRLKIDKNKETLIYCTGGIRCEKAVEIMKDKKFKTVYQLKGGILNYLKEYPNGHFEKECFVFDHRVAVDKKLQTSKKYSLCPHCGQPGDLLISCQHCERRAVICKKCREQSSHYETCSKNCAYHFKSGHQCRIKCKNSANPDSSLKR